MRHPDLGFGAAIWRWPLKYLKCLIIDNLVTLGACVCPFGRVSMLCVDIEERSSSLECGAGLGMGSCRAWVINANVKNFPHNNPSLNSARGYSSFFSNTPGILVLAWTDNVPSNSVLELIEAEYHTELEPNPSLPTLSTRPRAPI